MCLKQNEVTRCLIFIDQINNIVVHIYDSGVDLADLSSQNLCHEMLPLTGGFQVAGFLLFIVCAYMCNLIVLVILIYADKDKQKINTLLKRSCLKNDESVRCDICFYK